MIETQKPFILLFSLFVFHLLPALSTASAVQVNPRVVLTSGVNKTSRLEAGNALTAVMQEINKVANGRGSLENVRGYFTTDGFTTLSELVRSTGMFTTISTYRTKMLETSTGQYQVRAD